MDEDSDSQYVETWTLREGNRGHDQVKSSYDAAAADRGEASVTIRYDATIRVKETAEKGLFK
jgi:hypothetical protein